MRLSSSIRGASILAAAAMFCMACDDSEVADPPTPVVDAGADMQTEPEPDLGPEGDAGEPEPGADMGEPQPDGDVGDGDVADGGTADMAPPPAEPQLVINEVVPSPVGDGPDWIELTVIGPAGAQVALGEYSVRDDDPENVALTLPDQMATVGDFIVIDAVGSNGETGPLNANFKLGKDDAVNLSRGDAVADSVDWIDGDAPEGQSFGRLPDGTGDFGARRPTRGAPNAALDPDQPASLFPTEVVTVRFTVADADWAAVQADPQAGDWVAADLDFGGVEVPQVAVRTYGGASLDAAVEADSPRYPLRVDLNRLVAGQTLFGKSKFELDNSFADPSRLKVALAFQLFREFGVPAPRTAFADVWVNDTHVGLYTLIETIDGDFVDQFDDNDGDLYQPELPASALGDLGAVYPPYAASANIERNADSSDHAAFLALIASINRGTSLPDVLDVDVALRYLAVNVGLVNLDSYMGDGENYWLYADAGVFKIIPWDVNRAFGGESCGCRPADLIGLPIDEPTCGPLADRPLIGRLLGQPIWADEYRVLLERFIDVPAHPDVLRATITALANRIRPNVEADPTGFDGVAAFERAVAMDGDLVGFMEARRAAVMAQLAGEAPSVGDGNGCTPIAP